MTSKRLLKAVAGYILSFTVQVSVIGQSITNTFKDKLGYNVYSSVQDSGGYANYGNNENRVYKFDCNAGRTVVLNVQSYDVAVGDELSIYDGGEGGVQTILCGPCSNAQVKAGTPIAMTGSSAVIKFTSDSSGVASGFAFNFYCADTYTALLGTIFDNGGESGNIAAPGNYFQQIVCPVGAVISWTFTFMSLYGLYPPCTSTHLYPIYLQANSVFFNPVGSSGKYCATPPLPPSTITPSNRMLLYYEGSYVAKPGYALKYQCEDPDTDLNFADNGGFNGYTVITDSGGNASDYGNYESINYKFLCNSGRTTVFLFKSFNILAGDGFYIYDGAEGTTQTSVCGPCTSADISVSTPIGLTSKGAVIKFTSDGSGVAAGYEFHFFCADDYRAIAGTIYDSGGGDDNILSPGRYFQHVICPAAQRIRLSFLLIDLPGTLPLCTDARLETAFLQADNSHFNALGSDGVYCGIPTSYPLPVTTPSNRALLSYKGTGARPGYAIDYECVGTNGSSIITTNLYNEPPGAMYYGSTTVSDTGGTFGNYGNNETVAYRFQCNTGRTVALHVFTMIIDATDALSIYDEGAKQVKVCGPCKYGTSLGDMNSEILLTGRSATIVFTSDGSRVAAGYYFSFSCMDTYTALIGTIYDSGGKDGNITSPGNYYQQIQCPVGQMIFISFNYVDLPGTFLGCQTAYMEMLIQWPDYGISLGIPSITICGKPPPLPSYTNPTPRAVIAYFGKGSAPGYSLTYSCIAGPGTPAATTTVFLDPIEGNYTTIFDTGAKSANYGDGETRIYKFKCDEGRAVVLYFISVNIADGDSLSIYEERLGPTKLCGPCTSDQLGSKSLGMNGGSAIMTFTSDGVGTAPGYELQFFCADLYSAPSGTVSGGAMINDIASPSRYFQEVVCPSGASIAMQFTLIPECTEANLYSIQLPPTGLPTHTLEASTKMCGTPALPPPMIFTPYKRMLLYYEGSGEAPGYAFTYNCTNTFTFNDPSGEESAGVTSVFDSGGYDGNYDNNENKVYKFNCNEGRSAVFIFMSFDVRSDDVFSIHDGAEKITDDVLCSPCSSEQLLGNRLIGIHGTSAVMTFTSDQFGVASGYEFQFFCAESYFALSDTIYKSHGGASGAIAYPSRYMQEIVCPSGTSIAMRFTLLNLPGLFPECNEAKLYLLPLDGASSFTITLASSSKYCGTPTLPPPIFTPSNRAILYYDGSGTAPGYSLTYQCAKCVANYYVSSGVCKACPSHSYRDAGDKLSDGNTYCSCSENYRSTGEGCEVCDPGHYKTAGESTNSVTQCQFLQVCPEDYHVLGGICVPCPPNSHNNAGNSAANGNTWCQCNTNYYGTGSGCNPCPPGEINDDTDFTNEYTGGCKGFFCGTNQKVFNNACVNCNTTTGEYNAGGDLKSNVDTQCDGDIDHACPSNHHVSFGRCQECPPNSHRIAGDVSSKGDTYCLCDVNYRSTGSGCAACPSNTFKKGGDVTNTIGGLCDPCPANSYRDATDMAAMKEPFCRCNANHWSDGTGSCWPCVAGNTNDEDPTTVKTTCDICSVNTQWEDKQGRNCFNYWVNKFCVSCPPSGYLLQHVFPYSL
jgi:hypothetical protein